MILSNCDTDLTSLDAGENDGSTGPIVLICFTTARDDRRIERMAETIDICAANDAMYGRHNQRNGTHCVCVAPLLPATSRWLDLDSSLETLWSRTFGTVSLVLLDFSQIIKEKLKSPLK
ncbi:hypothetical protein TNCV_724501 [Trichonephila clavipes]|nr:hypothetical protein TNCV_724501 [Trichonephila clavipes]